MLPEILIDTFFFFFGLVVGSFLNVLAFRIPEQEGWVAGGRSRCRSCLKKLTWHELIPVVSFLVLRGKCLSCRSAISAQYPLVEVACGIAFLLVWKFSGTAVHISSAAFTMVYALFGLCVLMVVFLTDLRHFLIPDRVMVPAIGIAVFAVALNKFLFLCELPGIPCSASGVLFSQLGAGFFLALVTVSGGRWMGLGDVKLAIFMGLFLGFAKLAVALLIAFFAGSVVGIILILLCKKNLKSEVPFGAFLAPATAISFFLGEPLLKTIHLLPFRW